MYLSLTHSLVESLQKFLSVAELIVDGRNTYKQSQYSPQNNSNSQPEYTKLYLPMSTTLVLLPAIRSSVCFVSYPLACSGLVRPASSQSFNRFSSQGREITQSPPPLPEQQNNTTRTIQKTLKGQRSKDLEISSDLLEKSINMKGKHIA